MIGIAQAELVIGRARIRVASPRAVVITTRIETGGGFVGHGRLMGALKTPWTVEPTNYANIFPE